MTRRDIHLSRAIESDRRGVHHVAEERLDVVVGVDLVDRDLDLLPARSGECHVDIAFGVQSGTCYRMQVFGDRSRNPDLVRITGMTIRRDNHRAGRCSRGHARHQEIIGTDEHCALNRTKTHARTPQFLWAQSATDDPYFASGKSGAGTHRLNVRKAIDILFPKQAIRDPHELKFPRLPW